MEYSKDIILGINYTEVDKTGQAVTKKRKQFRSIQNINRKVANLLGKHKIIATISVICGILMVLDFILVHNFITLLQTMA